MHVERVGCPASPLVRVDEVLGNVVIEGHNSLILSDEDILSLLHNREALRARRHTGSLMNQLIILGIVIETIVVAGTLDEHIEEGVRVEIVAYPASAGNIEIMGIAAGVQEGLPLLVLQGHIDSEVLLPLLLHVLGNLLVVVVGVIENGELREILAIGETGFGEKLLGLVNIVGIALGGGITIHRGDDCISSDLSSTGDLVYKALLVDRHGERFADAHIIERLAGIVEYVIVGRNLRRDLIVLAELDLVEHIIRHTSVPVDLAILIHGIRSLEVVEREELDGAEFRSLGIPVLGVLDYEYILLGLPLFKNVGAVANEILGLGPCITVFLDGLHGKRGEGIVRHHIDSIGHRSFELALESMIINGLDGDVFLGALAAVELIGALDDHADHVGVLRTGGGIESAEPAIDEVLRNNRITVGPLGILAEIEGERETIGALGPGLGNAGYCTGGDRVITNKAFEEGHVNAVFRHTLDVRGVERLRLSPIVYNEIRLVRRLGSATAGDEHQRRKREKREKDCQYPLHNTSYWKFQLQDELVYTWFLRERKSNLSFYHESATTECYLIFFIIYNYGAKAHGRTLCINIL